MPSIELPAEAPPGASLTPNNSTAATSAQSKVAAYLALSRKRWQTAEAASREFRQQMRIDQRFAAGQGNQWEDADRQARENEGRPCIEINRIQQFIRQVSNQNRLNRSQIRINPRGKEATRRLATAIQGLVRSVEVQSDADIAYDTATTHQLTGGLGFVGLYAVWSDDDPFQQVARIRRIRNPLAGYWDPSTQDAEFSDMRWFHLIGAIGRDEYESRWGKVSSYASLTEFMNAGQTQQGITDWMPEGKVIVAEYYDVRLEDRTIFKMDTGQNVWEDEFPKFMEMAQQMGQPPPQVITQKKMPKRVVRWCLHNAIAILEGNEDKTDGRELPGTRIPIFPLIGDELDCDGEVDYRGMVRDARDPQRMYNFWSSSIAEAVGLAPKAPWLAAKGQVERYMSDWQNANREAKSVLLYDPKDVAGTLVPPPQRINVEPAIQAMVQGLAESDRDLMSVMGLFQPSLGERGSQAESGKAREALVQQGNIANSNYLDNLQRMKRALGRSLLEWFPVIYDVPRVMNLEQPDGKMREAIIYAGQENQPYDGEFGDLTEMYNIGVGAFDITVDTGPSFASERQATEAWLLDLFKVLPGLAEIGADIVLENSDNPAAQQLAARAKKAINPKFLDDKDPETKVAALEAQVQQGQDLLQKANAAIGAMAKVIETKEMDNDTKKQIAIIQGDVQLQIASLKAQGDSAKLEQQGKMADQKTALEGAKLQTARDTTAFKAETERFAQASSAIVDVTMQDMAADEAARAQATQIQADQQKQQTDISAQGQQADAQRQHEAQQAQLAAKQPQQKPGA